MLRAKQLFGLTAVVALSASIAVGCGDDDKTDSGSKSATSTSASKSATGTPIKIGFINSAKGAAGVFPEGTAAAKAATEYVNNDLGGVEGHPIDLQVCETSNTPESTQKCAQELAAKKPLFIAAGADFNMGSAYPIFGAAKLPVVGGAPLGGADSSAKDASFFVSSIGVFNSASANWAVKNLKPKSVAFVYDAPQVKAVIPLLKKPFDDAGVKFSAVQIDPTQSDFLGSWRQLNPDKQDLVIMGIGTPAACIGMANARKSQQSDVPVFANNVCNNEDVVSSAGDALNGWYIGAANVEETSSTPSAEHKIFTEKLKQYGGGKIGATSGIAFSTIMTDYGIMKEIGYDNLTSDNVRKHLAQESNGKIYMGGPFNCVNTPKPFPSLCTQSITVYQRKSPTQLDKWHNGELVPASF